MNVIERVAWTAEGYAGFWQRVGGYLIDVLIFAAGGAVLGAIAGVAGVAPDPTTPGGGGPGLLLNLVSAVAFLAYDVILTSRYGATVGKRAAGIEVRRLDGTLPGVGVCIGRYFARFLSALPLGLGFLWPAWDEKKQTFHDKIVKTYVLRRNALQPTGDGAPAWANGPSAGGGWGAPVGGVGAQSGSGQAGGFGAPVGAGASGGTGGGDWGAPPAAPGGGGWGAPPAAPGGALSGETMETARWGAPAQPAEPPSSSGAPADGAPADGAPADGAPADGAPTEDGRHDDAPTDGSSPQDASPADGLAASWGESPSPSAFASPAASAAQAPSDWPSQASPPPPSAAPGSDPNVVAIERATLSDENARWLQQVASQVDARLDRITAGWRQSPQADAARACAFGILLGHLARMHPQMAIDLGRVAEVHPSFSTLLAGSRLATLEQIAGDPGRATAWLGPLIDVEDRNRIGALLA